MPGNFPPPTNGGPHHTPTGGDASASEHNHASGLRCVELCPICRTADVVRATGGGADLRGQFDEVSREALLTMRSLIDHYLDRIDTEPAGSGRVEQIPID
jgi:hypothetical protein